MADRKVRAIFEAKVDGAKKNITGFAKDVTDAGKKVDGLVDDLKALSAEDVDIDLDFEIGEAKKKLTELTQNLADLKNEEPSLEVDFQIEQTKAAIKDVRGLIKDLTGQKAEVKVDVAIKDAQKRISDLTKELGDLRTQDSSAEVDVEIKEAQKKLRDAKAELRELNGAKAEMKVEADTSGADSALSGLGDKAADAGADAGEDAGESMVDGILAAVVAIPIAGAIIGAGGAIAKGLIQGIQDGLQIEAGRDLFSARTGLSESESARFGRAAGEAYANAWGESVEANMETARVAMEQGLIDADATDVEIEKVIASLSGVTDIMQEDIPTAARAAGQLIKTGMVDDAEQAFDVLVAGYQNGASASDDFLDTLIEYPTHFRDLGLSAEEATGLLIQGMDAGAFNADKVADSLKELTIRIKENSDDSAAALDELGLSGTEMADAFAQGGPKARDALESILTQLRAVEDPADRSRLAVALFGTQAEDMAQALGSLDLSKAADEIGGLEGSAGAAERALATMSDNTASKVESAKRNVQTAMDGIKGALAEAFGEEIGGVSDWVSKNRATMMQFFLDVLNGTFDAAKGFIEFGASGAEAMAGLIEAMDKVLLSMQPMGELLGIDVGEIRTNLAGVADGLRTTAETMRGDWTDNLDEMQTKANDWAGPELMKARVHDATMAMSEDMDTFSEAVDNAGGTVEINGRTVNAEQALDVLVENIDGEDGTVTINGNKVPAKDALDTLMSEVKSSKGSVKVGADPSEGKRNLGIFTGDINKSRGTVGVSANTASGQRNLGAFVGQANRSRASVGVSANTGGADAALAAWLGRARYMTVSVRVAGVNSRGGMPLHEGGIVRGLNAGGWVPGTDPGYDNVLWPLNSGGRTLQQPLAGGEMVVNSTDAAYWRDALNWINSGGRMGASTAAAPAASVARLHPDDRALLTRVADRPVHLAVDGRSLGIALERNARNRKGRGGDG